ncbi:MAG: ribose transport system ATP-binding protein [Kiritimatiellia bacterium]|jgi:ribose transport system ATP-binding protein
MSESSTPEPFLRLRGIVKRFPGVLALDQVEFEINAGEIVALIGENGAGKSTLMKVLGGVHQPDEGEILVEGKPVTLNSVSDANRLGIGFVHQELNNLDNIDVAGNVYLGREPRRFGMIDRRKILADTQPYLERLGLDVSAGTRLDELSIGQQQLVEIAKALSMDARVIIMDEPTSSLTLSETDRLLAVMAELQSQGIAIIYISHRLGEVRQCADRVIALKDGKNSGRLSREEITHDAMVTLMVGRELDAAHQHPNTNKVPGYFKVKDLVTTCYPNKKLSFEVAAGEILGFAGLVGAGRSEMAQAIFGVDKTLGGEMMLDDQPVALNKTKAAIARGIYLVPEDRKRTGLIVEMDLEKNTTLASMQNYRKAGFINARAEMEATKEQLQALNVKAPSGKTRAVNLSGGNQQKVVLGKWLSMDPKVMIFDEPTRGIDVGAKGEIYTLMYKLAEKGVAIIMISSDMEEVLLVSDRIAVMREGEINGILDRSEFSEEAVMKLAVEETEERQSA